MSFNEKPTFGEDLVNGGFFVLNRDVFDYVCDDNDCDFEYGPLSRLQMSGNSKCISMLACGVAWILRWIWIS